MSDNAKTDPPRHILEYIRDHEVLTLATASPAGLPRAATFTYVADGAVIYLWMRPDTMTARHIQQNPLASFTIDEYTSDWHRITGLQGSGEAKILVNPSDIEHARQLLGARFHSLAGQSLRDLSIVRLTASDIVFIDNRDETRPLDFSSEVVYSVFADLPERDVGAISSKLREARVEAGEVIVRQGAPADKFFIIIEGEAEVIQEAQGHERTVAQLGPGQFFGEIAILRDSPRVATVRATVGTRLLEMERDTFRALVAQSLGTSERFDAVIHERMESLS